jgi:hypothetical protein
MEFLECDIKKNFKRRKYSKNFILVKEKYDELFMIYL